ncbi:CTP:molybdopterin cytidylyltransferase MocA [Cognatiyoonia koreensis]|uniref:CTP:molybdopterin cytidylyltransferase MocA n=1 Tax=Cognatiyoonia koreensis TaxID=364200 RepID=A0A1I0P7Y4_9RHOB|nr:nucleotidyltransferase family protein [Cognatiyoonia koreensis]SEW10333.1 CTP:molybdopterin cytidylyltransferase MocA [Cognatiyoonia koreensis]
MTPILILAAGQSSRMRGADKLLQEIDGAPLLAHVVARAAATGHPVFTAMPGPQHPRYAAMRDLPTACYDIPDAVEGMSGTLRGAVRRLPPCDAFLLLLADQPEIETRDMEALFAARTSQPDNLIWRGATVDGKPGHPILFDASLRPEFTQLSGDCGAQAIVKAHKERTALVPLPGNRARLDLDTPEDWAAWRAATGRG